MSAPPQQENSRQTHIGQFYSWIALQQIQPSCSCKCRRRTVALQEQGNACRQLTVSFYWTTREAFCFLKWRCTWGAFIEDRETGGHRDNSWPSCVQVFRFSNNFILLEVVSGLANTSISLPVAVATIKILAIFHLRTQNYLEVEISFALCLPRRACKLQIVLFELSKIFIYTTGSTCLWRVKNSYQNYDVNILCTMETRD